MKKISAILLLVCVFCISSIPQLFAVEDFDRVVRDGVAKRTKYIDKTGADSGTSYVIASGVITVYESSIVVDTEADAASDTLVTLNFGAAVGQLDTVRDGDKITIRSELASQSVTIAESGNFDNNGIVVVLSDPSIEAVYRYNSATSKRVLQYFNNLLTGQTFTDLAVTNLTVTNLESNVDGTGYYMLLTGGGSEATPNYQTFSNSGLYGASGTAGLTTAGSWHAELSGSGVLNVGSSSTDRISLDGSDGTSIFAGAMVVSANIETTGNFTMSGTGNTVLTGTLSLGVATSSVTVTTNNTNILVTIGGIDYYIKAHTSQ